MLVVPVGGVLSKSSQAKSPTWGNIQRIMKYEAIVILSALVRPKSTVKHVFDLIHQHEWADASFEKKDISFTVHSFFDEAAWHLPAFVNTQYIGLLNKARLHGLLDKDKPDKRSDNYLKESAAGVTLLYSF